MNEDRYAKLQFVVEGAWGIEVGTDYLSTEYSRPKVTPDAKTTKTGHLELFRIEPLRAGLPSFSVRWDRDDDTVDIDLEGQPRDRAAFARPSPGFKGHKTGKVSDNPRTYKIDIKIPTGNVFKGTITLRGLGFGVRLQDGLSLAAGFQCEAEVIRSTPHNDAPGPPDPIKPN